MNSTSGPKLNESLSYTTLRRITTHTSGPGKRSSGNTARSMRKSATSGPLCPSSRRKRCQAEEGHCLASSSTVTLAGLAGCRRSRRGAGPLREGVWGGTQLLGRERSVCPSVSSSGQTLVSRGTSARYHNPAPAKRSRKAGESPYPSSHATQRAVSLPSAMTFSTNWAASSCLVWKESASGIRQSCHRVW